MDEAQGGSGAWGERPAVAPLMALRHMPLMSAYARRLMEPLEGDWDTASHELQPALLKMLLYCCASASASASASEGSR